VGEARIGKEFVWKPAIDAISPDLLQRLSDFAASKYKPINYAIVPPFVGENFIGSAEAYEKRLLDFASLLQRLHDEIDRRLPQSPTNTQHNGEIKGGV